MNEFNGIAANRLDYTIHKYVKSIVLDLKSSDLSPENVYLSQYSTTYMYFPERFRNVP